MLIQLAKIRKPYTVFAVYTLPIYLTSCYAQETEVSTEPCSDTDGVCAFPGLDSKRQSPYRIPDQVRDFILAINSSTSLSLSSSRSSVLRGWKPSRLLLPSSDPIDLWWPDPLPRLCSRKRRRWPVRSGHGVNHTAPGRTKHRHHTSDCAT